MFFGDLGASQSQGDEDEKNCANALLRRMREGGKKGV